MEARLPGWCSTSWIIPADNFAWGSCGDHRIAALDRACQRGSRGEGNFEGLERLDSLVGTPRIRRPFGYVGMLRGTVPRSGKEAGGIEQDAPSSSTSSDCRMRRTAWFNWSADSRRLRSRASRKGSRPRSKVAKPDSPEAGAREILAR